MKINTKIFGEVDAEEEKKLCFPTGIIGFPEMTEFILLYDKEKENGGSIKWLQSLQEPTFAMPVMDPLAVVPDYNPEVEDEFLKPLGEFGETDMLVLVTMTVPSDLTKMSLNLCAPIIIHTETRKACQVIVQEGKYPVKYPVYDILQAAKKAGE